VRVGIAGFGNVGKDVAQRLLAGAIDSVTLTGVTSMRLGQARDRAATLRPCPDVLSLAELVAGSDVIVECATAEAFPDIAQTVLSDGKRLVALSACGIPSCPRLVELARRHGGSVIVASGALPGLDIIRAASEGTIRRVRLTTRLRPISVMEEPYVLDTRPGLSPEMTSAVRLFTGTAAEAARSFPRHFNVAVSLSLAGIGLDHTEVDVWCDPGIAGTVHEVVVDSAAVSLTLISRNLPSANNPRTSRIVSASVVAALRREASSIRVGS